MTARKPQNPTDRCRLSLAGEIDMANAEDYLAVARAIIAGCKTEPCFIVDLSGVTFIDSCGLKMLVDIGRAAADAGLKLRLDRIPERVIQLLEITALADHFAVAGAGRS